MTLNWAPYEEPHAGAEASGCEPVDARNMRLNRTAGTACHCDCSLRAPTLVSFDSGSQRGVGVGRTEWS